jgi:hypothetical protein
LPTTEAATARNRPESVIPPVVKAESLLVQIPEQVERLDADIGAVDGTLEQAPEVLQAIRVNNAIDVLLSMVDNLVNVVTPQPLIRAKGIRIDL